MTIRTQQSLSGFIVTNPELTMTSKGEARFFVRVGQEHFQRNDDGSFTQLESSFHNLVQYRKAAERSYERFQKGDKFIAEGYVHEYDHDVDGEAQAGEEFVAKKMGHDAARQNYTVNRKTPVDGAADPESITGSGLAGELPATTAPTPVSARSAAARGSSERREQLADIKPKHPRQSAPAQSNALSL
jgi:single-strand DNA-binding protein